MDSGAKARMILTPDTILCLVMSQKCRCLQCIKRFLKTVPAKDKKTTIDSKTKFQTLVFLLPVLQSS